MITGWIRALLCLGIIWFLIENKRSHTQLSLVDHVVRSHKIPGSFHNKKIAFLSDLHNNEIGKENEKIMELLMQSEPDYVFVGGDMLVSKKGKEYNRAVSLLRKISQFYPVYCGNGNHEARLLWNAQDDPETGIVYAQYIDAITKAGVKHLCNETIRIENGEEHIYLSEIDLSRYYYKKLATRFLDVSHMEELTGRCKNDSFHILLAHNPAYFESYADWGADLTLSGHVHGGIMRLPFLGGVIDPSYHLFPEYDGGMFEKKDKRMIVSVGLGTHSIKIRLFNPPKIDVITLKCEKETEYE
ncbi:MAG: metallophosphoesterase [Lachnospiraceae bacterium]|nr:metallophosphoesterase [Lachnospiraceae bacterium]